MPDTIAEISVDDELAALSEFALLRENARLVGLTGELPPVRRVSVPTDYGKVSALRWGAGEPRVVFLHGGAQNAHTWDSVVLATGLPALALDLPGHGRSAWRTDRDYQPWTTARTLAPVLEQLAPQADLVVGMSLGGLTALRLAAVAPRLVRRLMMVDVTPGVTDRQRAMSAAERGTTALVGRQREFPTFENMLEHAAATAPGRDREVLRRGVLHNARRLPSGSWTWRYDELSGADFTPLWADVDDLRIPTTLVRGGASAFVGDEDVAEFRRRMPSLDVRTVPWAGHSVQTDEPVQLAHLVLEAVDG
jgi:esterase